MIYNFNLGIGWASSGVEYAQSYRANMLRNINADAKFIFTDMFQRENIEHMTENIGFKDSEIIWLYTFFSDTKISPTTYTLKDLEATFDKNDFKFARDGKVARYTFAGKSYYTAYMVDEESDRVHRVEMVSDGRLVRKDYFTYCRIFSEYYAPLDGKAHLYHRRFFNEDGTVAMDEINDNDKVVYRIGDMHIYSKEQLIAYMVRQLKLTSEDVVIIDRTKDVGQAIIMNVAPAKIGIVIHADHFSESGTNDDYVLWNNYYEYPFSQSKHIDFYVTATDSQKEILQEQFKKYNDVEPQIYTIPVGSIDELKYPEKPRKKHSFITASRLADEKHVDWLVDAIIKAKKQIPDVSLDIYGKGAMEADLAKMIKDNDASDYIRLRGHCNLAEVYKEYEAYLSGSTSEGFGLTLLEAIGSGLPIIGFDVRYGNKNFIDEGLNGYKLEYQDGVDREDRIKQLSDAIIKLCQQSDISSFEKHSYEKAKNYLTKEVEKRWMLITQ